MPIVMLVLPLLGNFPMLGFRSIHAEARRSTIQFGDGNAESDRRTIGCNGLSKIGATKRKGLVNFKRERCRCQNKPDEHLSAHCGAALEGKRVFNAKDITPGLIAKGCKCVGRPTFHWSSTQQFPEWGCTEEDRSFLDQSVNRSGWKKKYSIESYGKFQNGIGEFWGLSRPGETNKDQDRLLIEEISELSIVASFDGHADDGHETAEVARRCVSAFFQAGKMNTQEEVYGRMVCVAEWIKENSSPYGGSTVAGAIISPESVITFNAGDALVTFAREDGSVLSNYETRSHDCENIDEVKMLREGYFCSGGYIINDPGMKRIAMNLRSLGDSRMVSRRYPFRSYSNFSTVDVHEYSRDLIQWVIAGSDGIFGPTDRGFQEGYSSQQVMDEIKSIEDPAAMMGKIKYIANRSISHDDGEFHSTGDDTSIVVVKLDRFPQRGPDLNEQRAA